MTLFPMVLVINGIVIGSLYIAIYNAMVQVWSRGRFLLFLFFVF
jgi:type II secretory pathway component PulF